MKHYNVTVKGLVQGVLFRPLARKEANVCGVVGFARNEPDGSLYIEVEGEEENVEEFIAWCKRGPSMAKIDSVEVTEGELKGFTGFSVVL